MKFFTQIKKVVLERFSAVPTPASLKSNEGHIIYRNDAGEFKPYVADGVEFREIMQRERLTAGGTTIDPLGKPITAFEGGTGKHNSSGGLLPGNVGDILEINATRDGYNFVPAGGAAALANFNYFFIDLLSVVTVPDGQVMYLINDNIEVDGTLVVDGRFEELILDTESIGTMATSMLTEPQYQTEKGSQWILADGRDVTGSYYHAVTGFTIVPDMRGQFARGANNGRIDGKENPDGGALLGLQQDQAVGTANNIQTTGLDRFLGGNGPGLNGLQTGGTYSFGVETRPTNVTINYFIKIDY